MTASLSRRRLPRYSRSIASDAKAGILAWTKRRITNGALEGVNNKIKLVSHRSYGFRNDDRYIEAIYHGCSALPLPPDS